MYMFLFHECAERINYFAIYNCILPLVFRKLLNCCIYLFLKTKNLILKYAIYKLNITIKTKKNRGVNLLTFSFKSRKKSNNYFNTFVLNTVRERQHLYVIYDRAKISIEKPIAQSKINK